MLKLVNNNGFKWKNRVDIWFKGYLFYGNKLKPEEQIFSELENIQTKESMITWLDKANGCFSVVIKRNNIILFAVDNIRTFPIFYSIEKTEFIITDDPVSVFNDTKEIDPLAAFEIESAAYVTGKRTLFRDVYQVQAGEIIVYSNNEVESSFYSDFWVERIDTSNFEQLQQKLSNKLNIAFERLVNSLDGRQAVVPLSGGYDSRLIATMLKKFGYNNVYTFTYGRKGNYELENSKKTAKMLGFPWVFIEYNTDLMNGFINDEVFNKYIHFAGKGSSMFYMQDYFAAKYLHDNKLIEKDAVFIPGHSGDSIAGSHLRESVTEQIDKEELIKLIYKKTYIQNKHKKYRKQFLGLIKDFIDRVPENTPAYNIFESWVYYERQAKFVVNSASVFDFFGYEYRLPYWDSELVEFFKSVPFKYKLYKTLYKETVKDFYFSPNSIAFDKEIQVSPLDIKKQKIKDKLRPYLPLKIKLHYLEKNDWMAYALITKVLLNDLEIKKIPYDFKADLYNSIISKWYVECIREQKKY
ncbi:MAG: asparagine synthase C-terminal domain-containing protein [Bacteroidales bacterium]|nr:asparagine synthase C-terminal domain-containing protein [Bacteroidales bacterium]